MTTPSLETPNNPLNPLDLIEELVIANDWPFQRAADDEILVEIAGRWTDYRLFFVWQEEASALQFCCRLDAKVPSKSRTGINDLLARINERLWVGHFDVSAEEESIMFRHALLLRGVAGVSPEQVEDLVELALVECERFYPAFQLVIWGGKTADEAMTAAILDPVGEA
jgi:hypothetical protein